MAGNRKATEDLIIKGLEMILPGGTNRQVYQNFFSRLSDAEFGDFIGKLKSGEIRLSIIAPVLSKARLDTARNIEIGKRWGVKFFERLWIDPGDGMPTYLSIPEYMILELQERRQAQLLMDKISIPSSSDTIDLLTGQAAGDSKGGKLTYPETQILKGHELNNTLKELLNTRGGNIEGFRAMNTLMDTKGEASLAEIDTVDSEVESRKTLRAFYAAMSIESNW